MKTHKKKPSTASVETMKKEERIRGIKKDILKKKNKKVVEKANKEKRENGLGNIKKQPKGSGSTEENKNVRRHMDMLGKNNKDAFTKRKQTVNGKIANVVETQKVSIEWKKQKTAISSHSTEKNNTNETKGDRRQTSNKHLTNKSNKQITNKSNKQITNKSNKQITKKSNKHLTTKSNKQITNRSNKQITKKSNKQIKKEKSTTEKTHIRQKNLKSEESLISKNKDTDNLCIKKQEGELDFSCLDTLCKYKMKIQKKKEYEGAENFKSFNKTELKKKEKQREKEKLRENPENIVNSSLFRYINEYMYTNKSEIVQKKLNTSETMFRIYHTGYKHQVNKWPNNPTEIIISFLKKNFTKNDKISDWGCGEAQIAQSLQNWNITSFDLIKYNEYVTVGNITKLEEADDSYDCIVLSLSLMNTDWPKIIFEASRCLKRKGILVITEVASRFIKYKSFFKFMKNVKFKVLKKANLDDFFFFLFFENNKKKGETQRSMTEKKIQIASKILAPCLYKKR